MEIDDIEKPALPYSVLREESANPVTQTGCGT